MTANKSNPVDDSIDELMDNDQPTELNFEEDRSKPPRRDRTGGHNAGRHTSASGNTDDDMSPETLLDDGGLSPGADGAADSDLSEVSLDGIGSGGGLDEAELADVDPVGHQASRRMHEKLAEHAADGNAVEPAEAEMLRQARQDQKP